MLNQLPSGDHYRRQRKEVWIGLALTIALDTAAQLCWKAAASHAPESAGILQILNITFRQPLFLITILLFVLMFFNWMLVLSNADLSYAKPITSLSCVSVSVIAALWFKEDIPVHRMAGLVMILAGVWFISKTRHQTITAASRLPSVTTNLKDVEL